MVRKGCWKPRSERDSEPRSEPLLELNWSGRGAGISLIFVARACVRIRAVSIHELEDRWKSERIGTGRSVPRARRHCGRPSERSSSSVFHSNRAVQAQGSRHIQVRATMITAEPKIQRTCRALAGSTYIIHLYFVLLICIN